MVSENRSSYAGIWHWKIMGQECTGVKAETQRPDHERPCKPS